MTEYKTGAGVLHGDKKWLTSKGLLFTEDASFKDHGNGHFVTIYRINPTKLTSDDTCEITPQCRNTPKLLRHERDHTGEQWVTPICSDHAEGLNLLGLHTVR